MKTWLGLVLLGLCCGTQAAEEMVRFHFPDVAWRFRVGDRNAANPISNTEGPKALVSADMNLDGRPDVIAANLDGSVSVLLADTNTVFSPQILLPARGVLTNSSLRAVIVADLNGDKLPDVVVGDIARKGIVTLIGLGDGTLLPYERIDVGPVRALASGDFNEDGTVDLLVACSPPDCEYSCGLPAEDEAQDRFLCILHGDGDGSFGPPQYLLTPGVHACFYGVEAADMNGDGRLDALALDFSSCTLTNQTMRTRRLQIFANAGKGLFATNSPAAVLEPAGEGPRAFAVGYLDEGAANGGPALGGTPDIVVANRDSASIDVFLNLGGFQFSPPSTYTVGAAPRDVAIADIDQDGQADLVVVNRGKDTLSFLHGTGNGRFEPSTVEAPTGSSPRNIVIADFDGDGVLDAAVNNRVSSDLTALRGDKGFFGFLLPGRFYWAGHSPSSIVARDFDGDGDIDFATVALRSHEMRVRLNAGDGTFSGETIYPVNEYPGTIAAGDLTGDKTLDLVVSCFGGTTNSSLAAFVGQSGGKFATPLTTPLAGLAPYWVRLGDLDGDGILDGAVGCMGGQLALLRGRGDGTFASPVLLRPKISGRPLGLALGDFDGDGRVDIATSAGELLLNNGAFFQNDPPNGPWIGPTKPFPAGFQAWAVEADDLDKDGKLDLMLALTFVRPDPIGIYYGNGDGTFAAPTIYEGPDVGVVAMAATDLDDDGLTDIVIGNRCAATVMLLRGMGDRKFRFDQVINAYSVEDLEVADLNGDQLPDIIGVGIGAWPLFNQGTNAPARPAFAALAELPRRGLFINELMALNRDFRVVDGISPDWVEIYNNSSLAANLAGWRLVQTAADDVTNQWTFPVGSTVAPFERLTVYCERSLSRSSTPLSASFELSADGENISLVRPDGVVEDWVSFPALPRDVSYARTSDGSPHFAYNAAPTFGTPNRAAPNMRPSADRKDPYIGPGASALGVNARFFDDVAVAYAAVCYRLEGATEFNELPMNDDGLSGDKQPHDGYYGALLPSLAAGAKLEYYLRVVDLEGQSETSPEDALQADHFHGLSIPASKPQLRLTELVAANNDGLRDERGQTEDWVEVTNFGTSPARLDGLALTKDYYNRSNAWYFPNNTIIQPQQRLVVVCDNDPKQGLLHTTFQLLRDGDTVFLVEPATWTAIDALSFPALPVNASFGVVGAGMQSQLLAWPSPGLENEPVTASHTLYRIEADGHGAAQLRIRWFGTRERPGLVLSSPDLAAWSIATNAVSLGEGVYELKAPLGSTQAFFQLRQ